MVKKIKICPFGLSLFLILLLTGCPGPTPDVRIIGAKNNNFVLEVRRVDSIFSESNPPEIESVIFYRKHRTGSKQLELLWQLQSEHGAVSVPDGRITYGTSIRGFKSSQAKAINPTDKLFVRVSGSENSTPTGLNLEFEVLSDGTILMR